MKSDLKKRIASEPTWGHLQIAMSVTRLRSWEWSHTTRCSRLQRSHHSDQNQGLGQSFCVVSRKRPKHEFGVHFAKYLQQVSAFLVEMLFLTVCPFECQECPKIRNLKAIEKDVKYSILSWCRVKVFYVNFFTFGMHSLLCQPWLNTTPRPPLHSRIRCGQTIPPQVSPHSQGHPATSAR